MSLSSKPKRTILGPSPIEEMDEDAASPGADFRFEKQRSRAEIQSRGMGSKTASLYLSRTASLGQFKSGKENSSIQQTSKGADKSSQNGELESDSESFRTKKTSVASLEREFTFTGYDILADTGDVVKKAETADDEQTRINVQNYVSSCKLLGIVPVNYISRHINDRELTMKRRPLGPQATRAVCIALVSNRVVEKLNFEDNDIGTEGAVCIADMLRDNDTITELRLADNLIGSRGVYAFTQLLKDGKHLHTLDISGSGLEDADAKFVADIIEFNSHLKVLNVSHNKLSDTGAFTVGRAIAINDTLQELDISWNHIRGKGTLAVSLGLQKNVALKKLNLSWNGFALEGAKGLGRALEENRTLKELDVSNNRLEAKAVGELLKGLQHNDGLSTLKIGQNPFAPEIALVILKTIGESEKCVLTTLDLSEIVVRTDFLTTWDEIKLARSLPLRIIFGAVVKSTQVPAKDPNALDWRDPVIRLFKHMHDQGYRVIDMLKTLDKDGNFSIDRAEFKKGFLKINTPLSDDQLDEVMDRLDTDGDGEVDLGELLKGEKEFRRKMFLRMRKLAAMNRQEKMSSVVQKLMEIETL